MASLLAFSTALAAAAGMTSDSSFVFLAPETSFFWHTATNNTMALPVVFPDGADSATLSVTGLSYTATYSGIVTNEFLLTLPAASKPSEENVYDLTLTFNDGTVRTARLGLIQGLVGGNEGATRCLAPFGSSKWRRVEERAVFPIPYGVTAFSLLLDGVDEISETGLDGAAGWYALSMSGRKTAALAMTDADDVAWSAALKREVGVVISLR